MTIASRNRFIRLATALALTLTIACIVGLILVVIHKNLPPARPGIRQFPFPDDVRIAKYSPVASIASIGLFPLFALVGLGYILFAFEKTQTVEITFFAACLFAISLEGFRILIPLYQLGTNSSFIAVTVSRLVLFSRIFTILALLASGIFSTGHTGQQLGSSLFLLAFFSFFLANAIPVNSSNITSNFLIAPGYAGMIYTFLSVIGVLAVLSYYIPGVTKGIAEYKQAAGGIILYLVGYGLLTLCDSWLFLGEGGALVLFGAGIYLDRLHRYYLWQ
jgi:hypothetical protein